MIKKRTWLLILLTASLFSVFIYQIEIFFEKVEAKSLQNKANKHYLARSYASEKYLKQFENDIDQLLMDYNTCDQSFINKLQELKYRRAVLTEVYIVDANENICGSITGEPPHFSYNKADNKLQFSKSEDTLSLIKRDIKKGVSLFWLISFREIWNTVNLSKNKFVTIEYTLHDEFLLGIERYNYYTSPKQNHSIKFSHGSHVGHIEHPLKIHFYYHGVESFHIGLASKVRITLLTFLFFIAAVLYVKHLDRNLVHQIKKGLNRREFVAHYQPIVDMSTKKWVGAESLIRWFRDGSIYKSPDQFISIAESHKLSLSFSRICAIQSRELLSRLPEEIRPYISINISPNDLSLISVDEILERNDLNNTDRKLEVEVTERGIDSSSKLEVEGFVKILHQQNIRISLDDFGTGQAGLSYINSLHFDKLKIDKRFIDAIGKDTIDNNILRTIIYLAKEIQVELIAEGVETQEQVDWLLSNGVILAQGWYFERDLTQSNFIKKYLENNT